MTTLRRMRARVSSTRPKDGPRVGRRRATTTTPNRTRSQPRPRPPPQRGPPHQVELIIRPRNEGPGQQDVGQPGGPWARAGLGGALASGPPSGGPAGRGQQGPQGQVEHDPDPPETGHHHEGDPDDGDVDVEPVGEAAADTARRGASCGCGAARAGPAPPGGGPGAAVGGGSSSVTVIPALCAPGAGVAIGDIPGRHPGFRVRIRVVPHRPEGPCRARIGASHASATARPLRLRRPRPTPTPRPPDPWPRRRVLERPLRRSEDNRVLGGVCGGLAARLAVSPTLVRVVAVVSIALGGAGLLAYMGIWVLVSRGRRGRRPSPRRVVGDRRELQIVLAFSTALLAVLLLTRAFGRQRSRPSRPVPPGRVPSGSLVVWRGASAAELARMRDRLNAAPGFRTTSARSWRRVALRVAVGVVLILVGVSEPVPDREPPGRGRSGCWSAPCSSWVASWSCSPRGGPGPCGTCRPSAASGCGPRSGPTWPPTCTTRCSRPSR